MKFFVVVCCICSGLFASAQNTSTINTSVYSIAPPQGWAIDTTKSMGAELFLFSPLENSDDKFRDNINLMIQNIAAYGLSLDEYVSISEKQITGEMVKDGVLISSERMNKNGREYQQMIYTMTQGTFKLKILQHAYMVNGNAFLLTFTVEATKFDSYLQTATQAMSSFTIK